MACHPQKEEKTFPKFEDAKVGVLIGSSYEKFMAHNYPETELTILDSNADLFLSLDQEKIDVMVYDYFAFSLDNTHSKDIYAIYKDTVLTETIAIAFGKENQALKEEFNLFLKKIRKDGTYELMYNNWMIPNAANQMPDLSEVKRSGKPIVIACTGGMPHFDMFKNGRIVGFDPEIMERFAAYLGRPIEFKMMNFVGMIPAIVSGKCDAAIGGIAVTEERAKMVNFSDSHIKSHACGVALKKNIKNKAKTIEEELIERFENKNIGVLLGGVQEKYVSNLMKDADCNIQCYNTPTDLYLALESKKVNYIIDDYNFANFANYEKGDIYEILIEKLIAEDFGIIFNNKQTELLNEFNHFLAEIKEDGRHRKLVDKWLKPGTNPQISDFSDIERTGEPIKISCNSTSAPFDYIIDGKKAGLDIEIVEMFAAQIKRPIEYFVADFSATLAAVTTGKTHMGCGGITITEERKKILKFSDTHAGSGTSVITLKDNKQDKHLVISSSKDFKNRTIGVMTGSTQDIYATKYYTQSNIQRAEGPTLIGALLANKCDAILMPEIQAREVIHQNPDLTSIEEVPFSGEIGAIFNQKDKELKAKFDKYLEKITQDGTYQKLHDKYFVNNKSIAEIDVNFDKGDPALPELKICTEGTSYPYSFVKDNQLIGFDIELITGFAKSIGRYACLKAMNFESIIPAVTSGKYDAGISQMMITEERAKAVLFSSPYQKLDTKIIIKKENHPSYGLKLSGDGSDIEESTVGVLTGSTGQFCLETRYPKTKIKCYDDVTDALQALSSNKLDYVLTAYTTSKCATYTLKNIHILPKKFVNEGAAIAFRKDGTLDDIEDRWVNLGRQAYSMEDAKKLGKTLPANAPILNIATAATREPMCFIQNGEYMGLDIDLITRIAYELGMKPVFHDMKFSALTASLISGKTDVVISNFTKTAERAKKVAFSTEYYFNPQKLVTRIISTDNKNTAEHKTFFTELKESFYNNLILEYSLYSHTLYTTRNHTRSSRLRYANGSF